MDESGIVVESSSQPTSVAKGNESYTILDNPKTRDEFISQLLEVSSNCISVQLYLYGIFFSILSYS